MGIFQQATLTNLRNLRYGNDTIGGGNSGEPYITTPIPPALDQQADPNDAVGIDGGLIRGGFVGATNASAKDFIRIGKFLKDAPQGPRFIVKQIGLQLSNPQLEAPLGSPLTNFLQGNFGTLLGGSSTSAINIGPTRIYNGGINTLLQVPVNAFGGHIVRHGLLPIESNSAKYENVALNNDLSEPQGKNNRLVRLKAKLEANRNANIASYISGPDSIDGIGITTIKRYNFTLNNGQYLPLTDKLEIDQTGIILNNLVPINNNGYLYAPPNPNYYNAQGVSLQYLDNSSSLIELNNNILPFVEGRENNLTQDNQIDQDVINYGNAKNYSALRKVIDNQTAANRIGTAYFSKNTGTTVGVGTLNKANQVSSRVFFNVTGKSKYKNLDLFNYNIDSRLGLSEAGGYSDEVNLTPLYYADDAPGSSYIKIAGTSQVTKVRDLIKFRIEAVDNDSPTNSVWMIFRSYLKDITDTPNPSWNTVNYIGRGEPFYIYKGFERNISFTLQVAAMSEAELKPMWQKLNYLYSNTMPDYSNNVMRGPYMRLTLGDYMFRQPGVIKNMTYSIGNDSPWEIALDEPETGGNLYELPHVMTITMTFAPIHDFVPRKFPQTLNTIPGANGTPPTPDWKNLPAFMGDRQSNQNQWLTDIFGKDNKIPEGENFNGPRKLPPLPPVVIDADEALSVAIDGFTPQEPTIDEIVRQNQQITGENYLYDL
jgi:hypothetical protein